MHIGKAGKLQKHYEGGLGADSQEGRKKTTKSKKVIGQKVDGYRLWNKATLQRLFQAWFCYGSWMYVDTLHVSPVHLEKAENSSNSKSHSLDTQANWVPSCFSNTTRKTRSTTLRPWHPSGVTLFTLFVFLSCTAPKLKRLAHLPHSILSQNTFILRNLLSRNREFTHRSSLLRHL